MINISMILCLIAGLFGIFTLVKWFCILKVEVYTNPINAVAIIIGTLAWLSASVTFYQNSEYNSPIDFERSAMVVTWMLLIFIIKRYRDLTRRQQHKINVLRKQIQSPKTAK